MKTITVITGTRAEYGLLKPVIERIREDETLSLKLVVTGMHLCPEFGNTYKEIEADGYRIDEKLEVMLSSDTKVGMLKSTALTMYSFSEYLDRDRPDMILLLGDRFEIFAAAYAAAVLQIPIAHMSGGDITEGAVDEFMRHSITKMSYLHFTFSLSSKHRVEQLGEDPNRVFFVGSTGIENIEHTKLLSKQELEESINWKLNKEYAVVTFHPVTIEYDSAEPQMEELLKALDHFPNMQFIFTKANSDASGRKINHMIDKYVSERDNCIAFASLGMLRYLSALKYAKMVIGNSSSGILEAPSFHIPTVNIGDRQKGRIQAESVINCTPCASDISEAVLRALSEEFHKTVCNSTNPYAGKHPSKSIVDIMREYLYSGSIDMKKSFYDITFDHQKGVL